MACASFVRVLVFLGMCLAALAFGHGIRRDIPGMMFWPRPDVHNLRATTLDITIDDPSTYRDHVWRLESYLKAEYVTHRLTDMSNIWDCDGFERRHENMSPNDVCRFDIRLLGPCNEHENYGYSSGEPCIILRLGRLLGWQPKNYSKVKITCSGRESSDKANLGKMSYYPSQYIDSKFFPFLNQDNYMMPAVAVKFTDLPRGRLVKITCTATDEADEVGKTQFELVMN